MRIKTLLVFAAVVLLGRIPVADAGNVAPLAAPAAAFSAVDSDRSAVGLTFGADLLGADESVARIALPTLRNGTGDTVGARDYSTGLGQPVPRPSIGQPYGAVWGWDAYAKPLVGRHYLLVPGPGVPGLGILWPRMAQWRWK